MDASPLLARVVAALAEQKLETVLIGNAAAAMQGAPVTTLDFDFMFRDTLRVKVASLPDIITRKKAAGRDRDLAVLPVLEQTLKATQSLSRRRGS